MTNQKTSHTRSLGGASLEAPPRQSGPVSLPTAESTMTSPYVLCSRHAMQVAAAALAVTAAAAFAVDATPPTRSHLVPVSEAASTPSNMPGLGMKLSRASAVLRRQLAITRGAGLVVEDVTPGTSAARAGFEPHDVVVRLDDQILVLPEQLDALLESAEPEDPLACTVLRGGRTVIIPLGDKLHRPAPVAQPARTLRPTASSLAIVQPPKPAANTPSPIDRLSDETLLREDGDYRIQLTRGDETRLTVTNLVGQVVFDAPIDRPADQARIPTSIRGRVYSMMQSLETRPASQGQLAGSAPAAAVSQPAPQGRGQERVGQISLPAIELR